MPNEPLRGDGSRLATDSIAGYVYQLWYSLHAWLSLEGESALVLEGAEDIEIIAAGNVQAWQIKRTSRRLTLGGKMAREALQNFWKTQTANPLHNLQYRFVTTSDIGREAGEPFGIDRKGIDLWHKSPKSATEVRVLREFLQQQALGPDLLTFLGSASDENLESGLFAKVRWDAGQLPVEGIKRQVEAKTILLGEGRGVVSQEVESAMQGLFQRVLKTATSKQDRTLTRVDLLETFDRVTRRTITAQEYRQHEQLRQAFDFLGPDAASSVIRLGRTMSTRPPPIRKSVKRGDSEQKIRTAFEKKGVVYLLGSSGMGKTVLANALQPLERSVWVGFRASFDEVQEPIAEVLEQLLLRIERGEDFAWITLDDLNFSPDRLPDYQDALLGVLRSADAKKIKILITGQKALPITFRALCGDLHFETITVPVFSDAEIESLLISNGCPEAVLKGWVFTVKTLTSGHPQLVHAKVFELVEANWPPATQEDLVVSTGGISETKRQATLLLASRDKESADLLSRLSLNLSWFRRDQAIKIAELDPAVAFPGPTIDRLTGPWLEPVAEGYLQISPLLVGMAKDIWSLEKINGLRERIGGAVLDCGGLTLTEAVNVVAQIVLSSSDQLMERAVPGLLMGPSDGLVILATQLRWVCGINRDSLKFKKRVSWDLFLGLRLVVALRVRPAHVAALLEEIRAMPQTTGSKVFKLWLLMHAFFYRGPLPFVVRLELLMDLLGAMKGPWTDEEARIHQGLVESREHLLASGIEQNFSMLASALVSNENSETLGELGAFIAKNQEFRVLLKDTLNEDHYFAFWVVYKSWLAEELVERPDWGRVLEVLSAIQAIALEHDLNPMVEAALCAKMIVFTDYLGAVDSAAEIYEESKRLFPQPSIYLQNAQAKFLSHEKNWEEALQIWEEIIPRMVFTKTSQLVPIVARQDAAVAACYLKLWEKAAAYYLDAAAALTDYREDEVLETGLRADAAVALWRAGDTERAIALLARAVEKVEEWPNTPDELPAFKLRKCIGQVLLNLTPLSWPSVDAKTFETPFCFCSSFENDEQFRAMQVGRDEFLWVLLLGLENVAKMPLSIRNLVRSKLENHSSPAARVLFFRSELAFALSSHDLPGFVGALQSFLVSTHVAFERHPFPPEAAPLEAFTPSEEKLNAETGETLLDAAFAILLPRTSRDQTDFLKALSLASQGLPVSPMVERWKAEFKRACAQTSAEWDAVLRSTTAPSRQKLHAALLLSLESSVGPTELFRCDITVFMLLENNMLRPTVLKLFVPRLNDRWRRISTERSRELRFAPITTPSIIRATFASEPPQQKIANILLSVWFAVGTQISEEVYEWLTRQSVPAPSRHA